ncbi:DUF5998 family protein [Propionibacterium freudenreichii]|uniref:DUF5998 family protein n=1 Tax=Propionibacterium freudenreichii TaxID=1744 RepID=UPI0018C691C9|nr:DUF5998 family protein [Propionibacterium freudenreichii]MDK9345719.1 phosphodiesterase [Propionibacterium freudenreichii]WBF61216.1 DUF5998 family protein [Propionibacterium freudenreichii]
MPRRARWWQDERVITGSAHTLPTALRTQIADCGFFPQFVSDSVSMALGDEPLVDHLVQQEATVGPEGIIRHLTVLVLTAARLVVAHTDENSDEHDRPTAVTTTESVPLWRMGAVSLSRVVSHPEDYGEANSQVVETWLSLSWDTMHRLEVVPVHCVDPECRADHGFNGEMVSEDITLRMSPAADGQANVDHLVNFATRLQRMVAAAGRG